MIEIKLKGGMEMIKVYLSRIMGEKRIRIQELSDRTGLSRSTISMLYNEKAGRIDFKTLDKICAALDCQPADLLEYIP